MTGSWAALLSALIPLAFVVALSPLSIIPAVLLVLHTAQPRRSGLAFLFGWLAGLAAVVVVFVQVPYLLGGLNQSSPRWTSWVRIAIGAALILAGGWRWATRRRSTRSPTWLTTIGRITPRSAAAIGIVLVLINPKVVLATAAAGLAIGTAGLSTPGAVVAISGYTALAGSTAAVPILAYAVAAERVDPQLEKVKAWIECHQAGLTAAILGVIGLALLYTGARGL
jgi:hypothetical protein